MEGRPVVVNPLLRRNKPGGGGRRLATKSTGPLRGGYIHRSHAERGNELSQTLHNHDGHVILYRLIGAELIESAP